VLILSASGHVNLGVLIRGQYLESECRINLSGHGQILKLEQHCLGDAPDVHSGADAAAERGLALISRFIKTRSVFMK